MKTSQERSPQGYRETYNLNLMLPWRLTLSLLSMVFGLMGMVWLLRQQGYVFESKFILYVLSVAMIGLVFYLSKRIARGKVIITMDDEGIHLVWAQQFAFSDYPDFTVRWGDIVDYKFEQEYNYDCFRATLKDGTVWRLYRYRASLKDDDHYAFRDAFTKKVEQYNHTLTDKSVRSV